MCPLTEGMCHKGYLKRRSTRVSRVHTTTDSFSFPSVCVCVVYRFKWHNQGAVMFYLLWRVDSYSARQSLTVLCGCFKKRLCSHISLICTNYLPQFSSKHSELQTDSGLATTQKPRAEHLVWALTIKVVVRQGGNNVLPKALQRDHLQQQRDQHHSCSLLQRSKRIFLATERASQIGSWIGWPCGAETWPSSPAWRRRRRCTRWSSAPRWGRTRSWWRRWPCRSRSPERDLLPDRTQRRNEKAFRGAQRRRLLHMSLPCTDVYCHTFGEQFFSYGSARP